MELDDLGKEIQVLRAQKNIGLRELARLTDMSPASIVAIEKGTTSPNMASLNKILKALGSTFSDFFSAPVKESEIPVFLSKDMTNIRDEYRECIFLFPRRNDMRFTMCNETILSGEGDYDWEIHDCDIGGTITAGNSIELEIENIGKWSLKKGDSFYIKAKQKHRLLNKGKSKLKMITTMDPPKY